MNADASIQNEWFDECENCMNHKIGPSRSVELNNNRFWTDIFTSAIMKAIRISSFQESFRDLWVLKHIEAFLPCIWISKFIFRLALKIRKSPIVVPSLSVLL